VAGFNSAVSASFDLIPVNVITGFLGSGKTTLLQKLLVSDLAGETAVLVNEFGEVGIDHLLVREVAPNTVLLSSGCVCCSIRGDLKDALVQLFSRRQKGDIPFFRRVVLETTGLADPAPIFATLLADLTLRHHFRLGLITTVVDAFNADLQENLHPEWTAQVTAADRLILTKTDLVSAEACEKLRAHLKALNPATSVAMSFAVEDGDPTLLTAGLHDPRPDMEVERWMRNFESDRNPSAEVEDQPHDDHLHNEHSGINAFCLTFDRQINWSAFGLWFSMLLNRYGRDVLRVKGILNLSGSRYPIAIHGVQHLVHPPVHLAAWPDDDRRSRIVFIVRGIEPAAIERSFAAFVGI
jgi:G3E family GTPase